MNVRQQAPKLRKQVRHLLSEHTISFEIKVIDIRFVAVFRRGQAIQLLRAVVGQN